MPMPLLQQIILLSIPLLLIWPLTAGLVRFYRSTRREVSPQGSCFHAGVLVFLVSVGTLFWFSAAGREIDIAEMLGGIAYLGAYCGCCVFLNWFIFTVTETSMHTHLMVEVGREDGIALSELQRRYNKQAIIRARIPRLIELGQLKLRKGRLVLGGNWVLAGAEVCRYLRILLSIPPRPVQEDDQTGHRA